MDVEFHYGLPIPNPTPLRVVLGVGVETGSKSGSHSTVVPVTAGLQVGVGGGVYAGGGVGYYFLNQHRNSSFTDQLGYDPARSAATGNWAMRCRAAW